MKSQPLPHRRIVFVCTHARAEGERVSCGPRGGTELRDRLKALVAEHGLGGKLRVSASGCMDRCEKGPNLMAFPDCRWICGGSVDEADAIFEQIRTDLDSPG